MNEQRRSHIATWLVFLMLAGFAYLYLAGYLPPSKCVQYSTLEQFNGRACRP